MTRLGGAMQTFYRRGRRVSGWRPAWTIRWISSSILSLSCPHKGMLSWYYLFFVAHGGNTGKIMACVEDALTLRTQSLQGHISAHNSASLPLSHPRSCACLSTPKFALCHCHLSACPLWNPTCSIRIIWKVNAYFPPYSLMVLIE